MKEEKLSFFKKIKTSIFDFDGYQELAAEKVSRTIGYIVLLMLIFSILSALAYMYDFNRNINSAKDYINNEISEIKYEDYSLTVIPNNGEEITELNNEDAGVKVIINTQTDDEVKIQESIDDIKSQNNGILILKDKIIIKSQVSVNTMEFSYKDISEEYNINKIDKDEVLNLLSGSEMRTAMVMLGAAMALYMFIMYFSTILIDMFLLAILAYIVARISGLRLKISAVYNIAAYSLTLPVVLNIIYAVVNIITGFTIQYFQIMYTAIASIYVITSILMIKSDVIKRQLELNRIIEEQEKVREELKRKEEEEKEKAEAERRRREREKQKKKEREKEKEGNVGNEPEGDNA